MEKHLPFSILTQPDFSTCGPTCLQAIYHYYNDVISLRQVIGEIPKLENGGTLAVFLACHALRRGYGATIVSFDLEQFDPSWFDRPNIDLRAKLRAQAAAKNDPALLRETAGFIDFLDHGGRLRFLDLTPSLIRDYLNRGIPLVAGLSCTWLHQTTREKETDCRVDDICGTSSGHFVVLYGYDSKESLVLVADPLRPNPLSKSHYYMIHIDRVICAILLGILTHDANLLIIQKEEGFHAKFDHHKLIN
jgi:hypothetical protein